MARDSRQRQKIFAYLGSWSYYLLYSISLQIADPKLKRPQMLHEFSEGGNRLRQYNSCFCEIRFKYYIFLHSSIRRRRREKLRSIVISICQNNTKSNCIRWKYALRRVRWKYATAEVQLVTSTFSTGSPKQYRLM